ncbi:MAG TPA: zinc-binding dehydrogenase [Ktedonobacteraceae bacterium]|nr:zinc-binding dehydrogenase [Ktedonobacteraceae bacterium]
MLALVATHQAERPVEIREVEEPSPAPNEAIVQVHAFSLNRGELSLLANRPEGWRPGQDITGVILRRAADDSGPPEGSRVVCLVDQGGWSQQAAAPTARMAVLPDHVEFTTAATLPIAGLTALRTLRIGDFLLGKRVLITGAAGGVGRFAVELAADAGAEVTGVVASPERGHGLRELGAHRIAIGIDDVNEQYDLILESVGGESLAMAIRHIAPNGTIVVFGNSSQQPTTISFGDFAGHAGARIQAFFSYLSGPPESFGKDLAVLVALVAAGKLHPQIGSEASWRDVGQVMEALRQRRIRGKAVFRVD